MSSKRKVGKKKVEAKLQKKEGQEGLPDPRTGYKPRLRSSAPVFPLPVGEVNFADLAAATTTQDLPPLESPSPLSTINLAVMIASMAADLGSDWQFVVDYCRELCRVTCGFASGIVKEDAPAGKLCVVKQDAFGTPLPTLPPTDPTSTDPFDLEV
jgi:hypothetical protein